LSNPGPIKQPEEKHAHALGWIYVNGECDGGLMYPRLSGSVIAALQQRQMEESQRRLPRFAGNPNTGVVLPEVGMVQESPRRLPATGFEPGVIKAAAQESVNAPSRLPGSPPFALDDPAMHGPRFGADAPVAVARLGASQARPETIDLQSAPPELRSRLGSAPISRDVTRAVNREYVGSDDPGRREVGLRRVLGDAGYEAVADGPQVRRYTGLVNDGPPEPHHGGGGWTRLGQGAKNAGINMLAAAASGDLGQVIGAGVGGFAHGVADPNAYERSKYRRFTMPEAQKNAETEIALQDKRLDRMRGYAGISGVNPATGEPTPQQGHYEALQDLATRRADQQDARIDQYGQKIDQYDRRLGQYDADRAQRDRRDQAREKQKEIDQILGVAQRSGGKFLSPEAKARLGELGVTNVDQIDPSTHAVKVFDDGSYKVINIPRFGGAPTTTTVPGGKAPPRSTGAGAAKGQAAEIYSALGKASGGMIENPDYVSARARIRQQVQNSSAAQASANRMGLSLDDYAGYLAKKEAKGKDRVPIEQHAGAKAFQNWAQSRGKAVDSKAFTSLVQKTLGGIDAIRKSGKTQAEQDALIKQLQDTFRTSTGGADLSWFD
jgi:hypothetical protein